MECQLGVAVTEKLMVLQVNKVVSVDKAVWVDKVGWIGIGVVVDMAV